MQHGGGLTSDLVAGVVLPFDVMREIRQQLAPYHGSDISGSTVISDGVTIDSLTMMDTIMALEERFGVYIPLDLMAGIRTVDQLAMAVLDLCAHR